MSNRRALLSTLALLLAACGGSTPAPQAEPSAPVSAASAPPPSEPAASTPSEPAASTPSEPEPAAAPAEPEAPKHEAPKIDFPPNATVEQAISAVPQGLERLNMSQDALDKPLLDQTKFAACNVPASTHFTVRVAVFDGKAVGVDVTTKPKSKKLDACIDQAVRGMTWDKVASLNTVTASY